MNRTTARDGSSSDVGTTVVIFSAESSYRRQKMGESVRDRAESSYRTQTGESATRRETLSQAGREKMGQNVNKKNPNLMRKIIPFV